MTKQMNTFMSKLNPNPELTICTEGIVILNESRSHYAKKYISGYFRTLINLSPELGQV